MNDELWYFLLDGEQDSETGIVGNFYAYGQHLGDALQKVIQAAAGYDFNNANLTEATLFENFDIIEKSFELVEVADKVYMRPTTYTFPFNDPDIEFIPPIGIVKDVAEGEYKYDLIKENFVAYGENENGIFEFGLVVAKPDLIDVFVKSINALPTVDGFWIYIKNFWDDDKTELWVAKKFIDKAIVIEFLKAKQSNTYENGYLDIVVHSRAGETNLSLDEHKTIKLITKDENVFKKFIEQIIDLGYEQTREFFSLEHGFHHWHYRPANSLTRIEFKKMLENNQFELVDNWDE